ncbi:MAG: hypothetical protein Q4B85_13590 [Lachnospiraceae bacterium]|nr:hypothetical protein [Lachnospiraceae bacterium]
MKYNDFIRTTVLSLDEANYELLKKDLIGEYISFSVIEDEDVTKEILAEKLCDYFEKLELKTGKDFDKQVEIYIKDLDLIVGRRIAKSPQPKKNDQTQGSDPRSRKYYNKALETKNYRNITARNLIDYSRIMFCLYAAVIKNRYKEIQDFDFSVTCLDPGRIIASMKTEPETIVMVKKKRFDIKNLYCSDTCTFIMSMILLHKIINDKVQGEYYYE